MWPICKAPSTKGLKKADYCIGNALLQASLQALAMHRCKCCSLDDAHAALQEPPDPATTASSIRYLNYRHCYSQCRHDLRNCLPSPSTAIAVASSIEDVTSTFPVCKRYESTLAGSRHEFMSGTHCTLRSLDPRLCSCPTSSARLHSIKSERTYSHNPSAAAPFAPPAQIQYEYASPAHRFCS